MCSITQRGAISARDTETLKECAAVCGNMPGSYLFSYRRPNGQQMGSNCQCYYEYPKTYEDNDDINCLGYMVTDESRDLYQFKKGNYTLYQFLLKVRM